MNWGGVIFFYNIQKAVCKVLQLKVTGGNKKTGPVGKVFILSLRFRLTGVVIFYQSAQIVFDLTTSLIAPIEAGHLLTVG